MKRIGLVGCVKKKADSARLARDLYQSTLFAGRRAFVERTCDEWWILSAEHRLVHPDEPLRPYDITLKRVGRAARREWSRHVLWEIEKKVRPKRGDVFEMHAGADYADFGLVDGLVARGYIVEKPTEGMAMGPQLRFYKSENRR